MRRKLREKRRSDRRLRCFLYFHVSSNELIVAWIDNLSKKSN